jgi:hypothetical protein
MENSSVLEMFPPWTVRLLKIAIDNDGGKALTNNYTLREALKFLWEFRTISMQPNSASALASYLNGRAIGGHLLPFIAATLQVINERIAVSYRAGLQEPGTTPPASDYDNFVLQALGQSIADAVWPERNPDDAKGPPLDTVLKRYSKLAPFTMWGLLLSNYMANVLQYYFAASRIKETNKKLPEHVESLLRSRDAKVLVMHALKPLPFTRSLEKNTELALEGLRNTIIELLRVKKDYNED